MRYVSLWSWDLGGIGSQIPSCLWQTDILAVQRKYYDQNWSFAYQWLLVMSTQLIGFSMGGAIKRFLVSPPSMSPYTNVFRIFSSNSPALMMKFGQQTLSLVHFLIPCTPKFIRVSATREWVVSAFSSLVFSLPAFGVRAPCFLSHYFLLTSLKRSISWIFIHCIIYLLLGGFCYSQSVHQYIKSDSGDMDLAASQYVSICSSLSCMVIRQWSGPLQLYVLSHNYQ